MSYKLDALFVSVLIAALNVWMKFDNIKAWHTKIEIFESNFELAYRLSLSMLLTLMTLCLFFKLILGVFKRLTTRNKSI